MRCAYALCRLLRLGVTRGGYLTEDTAAVLESTFALVFQLVKAQRPEVKCVLCVPHIHHVTQVLRKLRVGTTLTETSFGVLRVDLGSDFKTGGHCPNLTLELTEEVGVLCSLQIRYGLQRRNRGQGMDNQSTWVLRPARDDAQLPASTFSSRFKSVSVPVACMCHQLIMFNLQFNGGSAAGRGFTANSVSR